MEDGAVAVAAAADSRYASRKFGLAVGVVLVATVLLAWRLISADQWVTAVQWACSGYLAANVGQKAVEALVKPSA